MPRNKHRGRRRETDMLLFIIFFSGWVAIVCALCAAVLNGWKR